MSLRGGRKADVAIPLDFRNVLEIVTPVCGLVRNDTFILSFTIYFPIVIISVVYSMERSVT